MGAPSSRIAEDVLLLPVDQRLELVNQILQSLNVPNRPDIEALWAAEAEKRVVQIESGRVEPVPGVEVFRDIRKRLCK